MKWSGLSRSCCVLERPHWLSPASQGCTVTTDLKGTATAASRLTPEGIPERRHISQDPLHHSMASASAIQRISGLKVISAIDLSNYPVTPAAVENRLVDTDREGECGTKLSDWR